MARSGDNLSNPLTGEQITFCTTAGESDGALLRLDLTVTPNRQPIVEHIHPHQEECFTVYAGTLRLRVNGREQTLTAGERVVVTAGTPHVWWNESTDAVQVGVEFRPALNTEEFFELMCGLSHDGRLSPRGQMSFLQAAVMAPHYDIFLARPPVPLQRALFALIGPFARLLGYRARYPQYHRTSVAVSRTSAIETAFESPKEQPA